MSAQMFYPIDVITEMTPLSLNEPSPGVFVLDFGQVSAPPVLAGDGGVQAAVPLRAPSRPQNFQGVVRLTLPAPVPANLSIRVRHAELLNHPPCEPRPPQALPARSNASYPPFLPPPPSSDGPVDGNIYVGNLRSAAATDYYTTRATAAGSLVLEPLFTVRGRSFIVSTLSF